MALVRDIRTRIDIFNTAVVAGPDPKSVEFGKEYALILIFPSGKFGGFGTQPSVLSAKVLISKNSWIAEKASSFTGVLTEIGAHKYLNNGPTFTLNYLAGLEGGRTMGEIDFDTPIDLILELENKHRCTGAVTLAEE